MTGNFSLFLPHLDWSLIIIMLEFPIQFLHGSLSHIFPLHRWGTPHFFIQHTFRVLPACLISLKILLHLHSINSLRLKRCYLCNYTNKLHTLLSSGSNKSKMWKKILIFPYSLNCFWQMITRKKIPSIRESVRKIIRGTSLNKSYMCRKINFMFIPSIIIQNCEGRAARCQALIMYHPYLHLYPDLVISISTDSPYIKQMT